MPTVAKFRKRHSRGRVFVYLRYKATLALLAFAFIGVVGFASTDHSPLSQLGRDASQGPSVMTIEAGKIVPVERASGWRGTSAAEPSTDVTTTSFGMCGRPPYFNCIIDGDTFYLGRQSIRIADIDTPETNPPRCAEEARLGAEATRRLHALLNAGPFALRNGDRDEDRYGRKLRTVLRDGRSIGDVLVAEGLAREWAGRRMPWC